jgi:hypothetical protein
MTGRRFLSIAACGVAVLLIAPGGAAGADPGNGQSYGHGKSHGKHHAGRHHHDQTKDSYASTGSDGLDPAVRLPGTTTDGSGAVTSRDGRGNQRGNDHWTRRELANHPGNALGLFKHDEAQLRRDDPAQPPGPATAPSSGNQAAPTHQHYGGSAAPQVNPPDPSPTDQPGSQPPTKQPPAGQEQSLSRLLPRAAELHFTALPLLITIGLALCIGGLIRLARLRA